MTAFLDVAAQRSVLECQSLKTGGCGVTPETVLNRPTFVTRMMASMQCRIKPDVSL
jgi:hypothetical protein